MSTQTELRNAVSDAVRSAQASGTVIDLTATVDRLLRQFPNADMTAEEVRRSLERAAVRRKVPLLIGNEVAGS